ncbi:XdhC family protein, partial [Burkholderia vietnamiensis]|uniref:XdhC family protein n=1 Tax=Burkholderia vietnamiensis TaxID=60552 RepID=UPI001E3DC40F
APAGQPVRAGDAPVTVLLSTRNDMEPLGSRRNNAARRERLREFDLSEAELARLHGPAGIYIGSRTPPEIAISILAEVTAAKNNVSLPTILQVEGAKAARELAASSGATCGL